MYFNQFHQNVLLKSSYNILPRFKQGCLKTYQFTNEYSKIFLYFWSCLSSRSLHRDCERFSHMLQGFKVLKSIPVNDEVQIFRAVIPLQKISHQT